MVDYFKNVVRIEEQNVRLSQEYFSEDLTKYELSVNVLAKTLHEINESFKGRVLTPEKKSATVMLAYRFLLASKCLFNIGLMGYYYEAQILLRSMEENVFYCNSFAVSNDCAKQWYTKDGLKLRKAKEILKLSSSSNIMEGYAFLCDFVHLNMSAVARFVRYLKIGEIKVPDRPEFTREGNKLFKAFRTLNISMLLILIDVFQEDLDKKIQEILKTFVKEEQRDIVSWKTQASNRS